MEFIHNTIFRDLIKGQEYLNFGGGVGNSGVTWIETDVWKRKH